MANKDERLFVGVDLGGTNVSAAVVDAKNRVTGREKKKTKAEAGEERVIERIAKVVRDAIDKAGAKPDEVGGVGIGAPGAINIEKGIVLNAVNLRWTDYPLAEALGDELKMQVTVDNDVNVGTWGEYVAGAGQGIDDMLGIFMGTGVGGGLVLDGKLYHGANFTAGEIGHTVINADAPLGRRTLENRASRTAVANLLKQLILSNHESVISELTEGKLDEVRSSVISKAFESGDKLTHEVIRQTAKYVGIAIANTVTLLSLSGAVLGGGLTTALGKPWVKMVREAFEEVVFPQHLRSCKIVGGELGDDAGTVGAAALARQRLGK